VDILSSGRAGAARFLLPLAIMAALTAGAAVAQEDEVPVEDPGVSEPGDPGDGTDGGGDDTWVDDPIAWSEPPEDVIEPGDGVIEDGGVVYEDGESVCDGCEAWTTGGEPLENLADGGERPVMENARGDLAARPNPRGKDGGGCSEDGFLPLPWRCGWN
jgi:hypothetical protein